MAQTDRNKPLYMISVAADLAGLHPQTLRIYEAKGLVSPQRTSGNTRMYSQADVDRLELIGRLTDEGINLAGCHAHPRPEGAHARDPGGGR